MAATPKGSDRPRAAIYDNKITEPDQSYAWLIEVAGDCGLYQQTGMGMSVLSWSEILAWSKLTGVDSMWLFGVIRRLSMAYVVQFSKSDPPACPSPLDDEDIQEQRKTVSVQFKKFMASKASKG